MSMLFEESGKNSFYGLESIGSSLEVSILFLLNKAFTESSLRDIRVKIPRIVPSGKKNAEYAGSHSAELIIRLPVQVLSRGKYQISRSPAGQDCQAGNYD